MNLSALLFARSRVVGKFSFEEFVTELFWNCTPSLFSPLALFFIQPLFTRLFVSFLPFSSIFYSLLTFFINLFSIFFLIPHYLSHRLIPLITLHLTPLFFYILIFQVFIILFFSFSSFNGNCFVVFIRRYPYSQF